MTLAERFYAFAKDHYNDAFGWSVIVECWSIEDIHGRLVEENAQTLNDAIRAFLPLLDVWNDRYADAENSAF